MIIFAILGVLIIVATLVEAFETIVLPRRVTRRFRFSRIFYRELWNFWRKGKKIFHVTKSATSKDYLGVFGPVSLILLIGLWAIALIVGFAFIHYGVQTPIISLHSEKDFITYLYLSGANFFPVEVGEISPTEIPGKFLGIIESGLGLAFLAVVIGYLPVLYQGFSRREVNINLLDSHAGSPPSAFYMLRQLSKGNLVEELKPQLVDWERWSAELLETHISYPVLAYYRSQHDDQSWVAALLMILDASALILVSENKELHSYAKATFAIARHAAVDLTQVFGLTPHAPSHDRLPKQDLDMLRKTLRTNGFPLKETAQADEKLLHLRKLYEPYMQALSTYFILPLSPFVPKVKTEEAWRQNI